MPVSPLAEYNPQRAGNKNRRITATGKANQQCKGKIFGRITTEKIQRQRRKQHGEHRIQRTCQRLQNRRVNQLDHIAAPAEMELEILTNTIEDNNRIINGIADNRQQRRYK